MELARNKKAYFDYEVLETYTAGLVLQGHEVKSIRNHQINLKGGHVSFKNNEAWLENVQIAPYQPKNQHEEGNEKRKRKLLLQKREIAKLENQSEAAGITIVPLRVFLKNQRIKIEIGLCRGKKQYDKRETIKKKSLDRELKRSIKIR